MATDLHTNEPSLTELVTGIVHDGETLIKQQFEMFKCEIKQDLRKAREGSLMLGIGAGLGLVGGILLIQGVVFLTHWLVPSLPEWACFVLWGVLMLVGAVILAFFGKSRLEAVRPLDDQSAQTVKENLEWITNPK